MLIYIILKMLLLTYIYIYGSIVFHEAGHFVFCYVFKVPIKKVQIGSGKTIIKIGLFEFNLFPTGGSNIPYSYDLELPKFKKILIFLGGVIGNLFAIIICPFMILWVFWNFLFIIGNLIPIRNKRTISDGLYIISFLYDMKFLPIKDNNQKK